MDQDKDMEIVLPWGKQTFPRENESKIMTLLNDSYNRFR